MRTGFLVALLGIWVIARSVTQDDTGRTLPDYILRKPIEGASAAGAASAGAPSTGVIGGVAAGLGGLGARRRRRPPRTWTAPLTPPTIGRTP